MSSNFFRLMCFINIALMGSDLFCVLVAVIVKQPQLALQSLLALAVNGGAAWLSYKAAERNAE